MIDYIDLCKKYHAATKIPIHLLYDGREAYSAIGTLLHRISTVQYATFTDITKPGIFFYRPDVMYGCVHVNDTDYTIVLGPVFEIPPNQTLVNSYMLEAAIPNNLKEQVTEFLYSSSVTGRMQLAKHLSFLHSVLNHEHAELQEILWINPEDSPQRETQNVEHFLERQENEDLPASYYMELGLYEQIRSGNVTQLIEYLKSTPLNLNEKKLAKSPLRQAKNLFINIITSAGMLGAIPGGVAVQKIYHLIEMYIQECEQLQSLEAIDALQYQMLLDFCEKVSQTQIPEGISSDVYVCMNYIRSHTNEHISLEDVAAQIGKSVSYMTKKFKQDLGVNPGAYMNRCKLEESKSLLTFTEKSLAEISSHLCYSSQSHFQNAFKKQYGLTPMQYRTKTRKT